MADARRPRKKKAAPDAAAEMRRQAEERLAGLAAAAPSLPVPEELAATVHELHVHQIELEMQNEELRRAQLELDAQRAKYFELFDLAPVGYLTLSDKGIVDDANFTAAHLLGVERQPLVGQPFSAFIFAPDRDVYYGRLALFKQTEEPQTCEVRLRRAGGKATAGAAPGHFWARLECRPQRAADGETVAYRVTFSDVDAQVAAAEALTRLNEALEERVLARTAELAESEQFFRLTFEQAPIGAVLAGRDFRFRRVNARFAQMTGYSIDELLTRGFPDITHSDDVAADVEQVKRLVAGELDEYAREKRYVRKDGSIAWGEVVVRPVLDAAGETTAVLALVNDVTERRHVEEERARLAATVWHEKERLVALIDSMTDEVWLVDEKARFTLANPAALQAFGAAAEGAAVTELVASLEVLRADGTPRPPEEAPPLRALAGEEVRNDEEIVRTPGSGELRHRLVNATPLRAADGAVMGCVCVVRDVTELRLAEQAVRRERDWAQSYLDVAGVMLVAIAADQTVLLANRKACAVLERDEAEIVGANWFDLALPPAAREPTREAFSQLMADNLAPWEYVENLVVTRSGEERLIAWRNTVLRDDGGAIVATLSSGEDITARRQAEEELRGSEARFRTIFEEAPLGVALIDSLDGRIYAVNPRFAEIAGRTRAEMAVIDWMSITHPDDVQEDLDNMALLNAGKIPGFTMDKRYLRPDGSAVWINMTIAPMIVADGGRPRHLCMIKDITARKQTERLLSVPSEVLELLAAPASEAATADGIVAALQGATGFDAVGLRLQVGDDYPFVAAVGYSDEFLRTENALAVRYSDGGVCREEDGTISLECTCGLVLTGKTDPESPLFTPGGSAWTNDSLPFLEVPPEDDPRLHPRNRCIHVGFLSIALVPLRAGQEILGLLHLADRRKDRFTPESIRFFEGLGASIGVALLGKRAEEALRESEERYRTVADFTYDWEAWRAPDGTYLYVSPSCARISGHAASEFLADADLMLRIAHPDDRCMVGEHFRAVVNEVREQDLGLDYRILTASGETRWIGHRCTAVRGEDGQWLGRRESNRDITAQREAEDALRESDALYRSILSASPEGIAITDLEGRLRMASPAALTIFGYEREEAMLGRALTEFMLPEDRERALANVARLFQGELVGADQLRALRADGSVFPIEVNGELIRDANEQPTGIVFILRDITARQQVEEKVAHTLSLLESTMESTADGILVADGKGGMVRSNMRFREIWGIPEALAAANDDDAALSFVLNQLKEPQRFLDGVRDLYGAPERSSFDVLELKDGRVFERFSQPQRIDGSVVDRVWSFRDVTARRRSADQLAQLNADLLDETAALAAANATITRIAATDHLTGLANRRCFYEALDKAVSLARRHGSPLALVSFDLDGLKRVNDGGGHAAGDEVLASFAALLIDLCRAEDLPARLGGDEFCVLLPGMELGGARGFAERLVKAARSSATLAQRGVTVSGGVAAWTPDEPSDGLLRRADEALYAAKRDGGDAVAGDG
jgi:diguanylate cyclase (GGDEF)-like protein/PAS domain S-box-containing protein